MIARTLNPLERSRVKEFALRGHFEGPLIAASMAAREFFGETLDLGCADLPAPRTWNTLTPQHVRRMVERVEGNAVTLKQKLGCRIDLLRMAGSRRQVIQSLSDMAEREAVKKFYDLLHRPPDPEILARTLAD